MSHTPFPHISECELFLKESSQRGSRLVVMGGSSAYGMRGGRVEARGEWEMGQSSRLIRPQRCSKDTAVLFLDWAGASLAIRIVSRHFFLKSPLFFLWAHFLGATSSTRSVRGWVLMMLNALRPLQAHLCELHLGRIQQSESTAHLK